MKPGRKRLYTKADAEEWRKWMRDNRKNMTKAAQHFGKNYKTFVKVLHAHLYGELE